MVVIGSGALPRSEVVTLVVEGAYSTDQFFGDRRVSMPRRLPRGFRVERRRGWRGFVVSFLDSPLVMFPLFRWARLYAWALAFGEVELACAILPFSFRAEFMPAVSAPRRGRNPRRRPRRCS